MCATQAAGVQSDVDRRATLKVQRAALLAQLEVLQLQLDSGSGLQADRLCNGT